MLQRRIKELENQQGKNFVNSREKLENGSPNEFLYELGVNEDGHISCILNVGGKHHAFSITENDAKAFIRLFQMNKMLT